MLFLRQVDQELATGEFFLRDSVKKRKKMVEIKVSSQWTPPTAMRGIFDLSSRGLFRHEILCFLSRPNRPRRRPRSRKSETKPSSLPKRSRC